MRFKKERLGRGVSRVFSGNVFHSRGLVCGQDNETVDGES